MKKIAVMTWYLYRNYGTVLQAVALNRTIRNLGYDVSTIAYDPSKREKPFVNRVVGKIKRIMCESSFSSSERDSKFDTFIKKNLTLTKEIISPIDFQNLNQEFVAFVCGSDQIWGAEWLDTRFYLDFVDDSRRKIAYAPSFGCTEIVDSDKRQVISHCLKNIANISVREKSGAEIVKTLIGKKPCVALDPTLLLDERIWKEFVSFEKEMDEPYCLFYFLGNNQMNYNSALNIAKKQNLKVKLIPVFTKDAKKESCVNDCIGPSEFLSLIKHASYICTDSFHGMVFSVIFHKQFVGFERFKNNDEKSQNTRIYNFLNQLDLNNILLRQTEKNSWENISNNFIDYEKVDKKLSILKENSIVYLKDALNQATLLSD